MPRYLRWLVAISSGIMATFTFTVLIAGVAKATGRSASTPFGFGYGSLVALGATVIPSIVMLAINDWLAGRYPELPKRAPEPLKEKQPADQG